MSWLNSLPPEALISLCIYYIYTDTKAVKYIFLYSTCSYEGAKAKLIDLYKFSTASLSRKNYFLLDISGKFLLTVKCIGIYSMKYRPWFQAPAGPPHTLQPSNYKPRGGGGSKEPQNNPPHLPITLFHNIPDPWPNRLFREFFTPFLPVDFLFLFKWYRAKIFCNYSISNRFNLIGPTFRPKTITNVRLPHKI